MARHLLQTLVSLTTGCRPTETEQGRQEQQPDGKAAPPCPRRACTLRELLDSKHMSKIGGILANDNAVYFFKGRKRVQMEWETCL